MRKSTSLLAVGALATGAALTLLSPGIASASGCGTTTITTQEQFNSTFEHSPGVDDTRSAGHNVLESGYLHVYTDDNSSNAKATGYYPIGTNGVPLADQTAQSNYKLDGNNLGGTLPGYQLIMDMNGAAAGGYAALVYEPDSYGEGQWWSNSTAVQGVPAGAGYAHLGTLDQYSRGNPDAVIQEFGYSLGSGVKGDYALRSITFGCNVFAFDKAATPPAENKAPTAAFTATADQLKVDVDASTSTDTDGTIASYQWNYGDGDTSAVGPKDSHTYAKNGTYTVSLTVTDDKGATNTVTKDVKVVRSSTVGGGLPNTGASVMGLGAIVVVAGGAGAAGIAVSRRRKADATV